MKWFLDVLKNKYATFEGRARRSEYWYYVLFYVLAIVALAITSATVASATIASTPAAALVAPATDAVLARLLGLADRATRAPADADLERPGADTQETAPAFLDARDLRLGALQAQLFETLANRFVERLAFVNRTLAH